MNTPTRKASACTYSCYFVLLMFAAVTCNGAQCPTTDEITSRVALSTTPLAGQALSDFNAIKALAINTIETHGPPPRLRGTNAPSPQDVLAYLVNTAQEELGEYILTDLLDKLCNDPNGSNYFPNTCGLTHPKSGQSTLKDSWAGLSSGSNFDQLRVSLRLDVQSLPACLLFQRTHNQSLSGYLLASLAKTLIADQKHDFKTILHSLATNSIGEAECSEYPKQQNAGCQIYLTVVAVDAAIIARSGQSSAFTYKGVLNGSDLTALDDVTADFAGSYLANLSIAHCGVDGDPNRSNTPALCTSDPLLTWWTDYLGELWYRAHHPTQENPTPEPFATVFADFLTAIDAVAKAEQIVRSLQSLEQTLAAPAAARSQTTSEKYLVEDAQAQIQQLQLQLLGAIAELTGTSLSAFGRVSFPTLRSDGAIKISDSAQAQQIQQVTAAVVYALYAYRDFQQHDYADGVTQALAGTRAVVCNETKSLPADARGRCGFLLNNPALGTALQALGYVATLASASDAPSFATAARNISGGVDAWKRKNAETLLWAGSFVGVQGGKQWLSAPGYSHSNNEYGLFAPLGIGYSWPTVLFNRPLNIYASVVDLGSLITTSTGNSSSAGTVKGGANSGWSQLLAPGLYTSMRVLGPIYFGVGYAFRTPSLRSVTLPNNTMVNADSSRLQIFLGVDVPLFSIHF